MRAIKMTNETTEQEDKFTMPEDNVHPLSSNINQNEKADNKSTDDDNKSTLSDQNVEVDDTESHHDESLREAESETEEVVPDNHNSEGEIEDNKSRKKRAKESKKAKAKSEKKPTSPTMKKITKAIAKTFVIGTMVIGAGATYIYLSENGYFTMIANSFSSEESTSELDNQQNEQLSKLQLQIRDTNSTIENFKNQFGDYKTEQVESHRKVMTEITNLANNLQSANSKISTELSEISQELNKTSHRLQQNIDDLKVSDVRRIELATLQQQQSKSIAQLQASLRQLDKEVNGAVSEIKKAQESAAEIKEAEIKKAATSNSVVNSESQEKPIQKIRTYSGLSYTSDFSWGSELVAILSDGTGSSFQVNSGTNLGDATIKKITPIYLELQTSYGTTLRLYKEGR